jgi:hypothetical protein
MAKVCRVQSDHDDGLAVPGFAAVWSVNSDVALIEFALRRM